MRIRDPQTGHSSRAGRSTRSRSGGTRAEVRAIPHLPSIQRQPPPPQTDYQTVSFAILVFLQMLARGDAAVDEVLSHLLYPQRQRVHRNNPALIALFMSAK